MVGSAHFFARERAGENGPEDVGALHVFHDEHVRNSWVTKEPGRERLRRVHAEKHFGRVGVGGIVMQGHPHGMYFLDASDSVRGPVLTRSLSC